MRLPTAVLLFLLLCGSLHSSSIQSQCDVKCITPKSCIINSIGDVHTIQCRPKLGMRLDHDDYYTAGKKWTCNAREYGPYWVDAEFKVKEPGDPLTTQSKNVAWRTIKTIECVEKLPCHLMSPLVSSCRDTLVCSQISVANSEKIACSENPTDDYQLYATHSATNFKQQVPFVECNDKTGQWMSKNLSGLFVLPKGSNIRCLRRFVPQESDRFEDTVLRMEEEGKSEHSKLMVKYYYQAGAFVCLLSCFLSAVLTYWMYFRAYLPRIRAYKHEWSAKQIHGGWRENYGRPRANRRRPWRFIAWLRWWSGCDRKPMPTMQNVYDDVSTCVSLTESSDVSDCEECDRCKICPDWMNCDSMDDLADRCSTCSGRDNCCSISTCSCTGPQPETTCLSFSGTENSEYEEEPDEENERDKCTCKRLKRCHDRTCCRLPRKLKQRPMRGFKKKAKILAKETKKMVETKEWKDFYTSTNARLMGINNETKLSKIRTKADIEEERIAREEEKAREADPEKAKEEDAKKVRCKERLRLEVYEDGYDSALAIDKCIQMMHRYREGYDGFEDNDDLEEEEIPRRCEIKKRDAFAYLRDLKRKADAGKKKEEAKEDQRREEEEKEREKDDEQRFKDEQEELKKLIEKEKNPERKAMYEQRLKEAPERFKERKERRKEREAERRGEVEGPPRKNLNNKAAPSRVSKKEPKVVAIPYMDKKKLIAHRGVTTTRNKEEPIVGNLEDVLRGTAVNLNNPKRLTRAETKRM